MYKAESFKYQKLMIDVVRKLTIELELRNLFGFYILKKRIHSLTCDLVGILSD